MRPPHENKAFYITCAGELLHHEAFGLLNWCYMKMGKLTVSNEEKSCTYDLRLSVFVIGVL